VVHARDIWRCCVSPKDMSVVLDHKKRCGANWGVFSNNAKGSVSFTERTQVSVVGRTVFMMWRRRWLQNILNSPET
jgi:hypothetical protein